tara:strand:+ start:384 stop:647 length:264 start_codon:yes stop_codon:yes gene_type:complete
MAASNYKIRDVCFATEIEDNLIILNSETGKYLELNSSAKFIWKLIENGKNFSEILTSLLDEFEVSREEAQSALDDLLLNIKKQGLID